MKLHTIARRLPEEICATFEPILPPIVWCGNGRPPVSDFHQSVPLPLPPPQGVQAAKMLGDPSLIGSLVPRIPFDSKEA